MKYFQNFLAVVLTTFWISLSEFFRNEILLKSLWQEHFQKLGIFLPSQNITMAFWGIWSFMFTGAIYNIAKKFPLAGTALLSWFVAFPMMWVMLGFLGIMSHNYMLYSTPLTLIETFVAAFIIKKISN
jgi:Na+-transporting NADH:ubiquinone oxidoreductase subunit NqrE